MKCPWRLAILVACLGGCARTREGQDEVWRGLERIEVQFSQKLLIVKGSKGIVACPYLNPRTFEQTGEACAIVPAADFEGIPAGKVRAVTPQAEKLGIAVGMSGREALERIR